MDPDVEAAGEYADAGPWTLGELPSRVAALLAGNYEGQSSGRVGELPTERTVRWYATIGLVDRPVATRGRVALYGPRHVLQLAAIKKLQSEGRSLAEIQQRLLGASDPQLTELVGAPRPVRASMAVPPAAAPAEFWKRGAPRRPAARPPTSVAASASAPGPAPGPGPGPAGAGAATAVPAIRLGDTVTLVLGAAARTPDADELDAIAAAAVPLLDLLVRLGLAPGYGFGDLRPEDGDGHGSRTWAR
ncbi:hypothetical protein BCD49_11730 [Pseudofrankia sp. EUN1h]|nr:hypothetical protein BCD49_11730 [Pseudofrankia sp. EUN1h]